MVANGNAPWEVWKHPGDARSSAGDPHETTVALGKQSQHLICLCLGAHSDDIEIGCGGTILRLHGRIPRLAVTWVVFGASGQRAHEARHSAEAFLKNARSRTIDVKGFRDGFLPYVGGEVKDDFEALKADVNPDLILTHYRHDLHQDHRLDLRAHLEHLSRSSHLGIRSAQVRW